MNRTAAIASLVTVFALAGVAGAYSQGMLLNFAAERVVQKHQTSEGGKANV
jgi:hypothetical protein